MKPLAVVVAALILAGCAETVQVTRWDRAATTQQQFYGDRYDCLTRSTSRVTIGSGPYLQSRNEVDGALYEGCMAARGYVLNPKGAFAPPGF